MVAVYIIILCLSTLFAAYAPLLLSARLGSIIGRETALISAGVMAAIAAIAFMVVVAVPAMVLVGALLLLGLAAWQTHRGLPPMTYAGGVLIAVLLGCATLHLPAITHVPPAALIVASILGWYVLSATAKLAPEPLPGGTLAILFGTLPLLAAPFFGAPSSIALDSALILSALLGALLTNLPEPRLGAARAPFAYLLAWLILQAALHGAWAPAAISTLAWCGAIAYGTQARRG